MGTSSVNSNEAATWSAAGKNEGDATLSGEGNQCNVTFMKQSTTSSDLVSE
jgi:hypothetical protein